MSDEEKKAIEKLKEISHYCSLRAIDIEDKYSDTWAEYVVSIQKVFNLIEKQSKEIEELKEGRLTLFDTTVKNSIKINDKRWEDKIKAKIEEYKKQIEKMEKDDIGRGFTLGKKWSDLKAKVEFGQSLLEKE